MSYRDRYSDDYGGERWDRKRFERVRARSRGPPVQERPRAESFDESPEREDFRVEVDERRRGPQGRYKEDEVVVEKDVYNSPRRRRQQEEEPREQSGSRDMMPYRPRQKWERESEAPARRPARPGYARRQSSLDTYDRRPLPKYSEEERDINVSINVNPGPDPRIARRSPREHRYKDPYDYPEEPRDYGVRREVVREIIRVPEKPPPEEESSSSSSEQTEAPSKRKKGKTRMPKRLVHKAALIQCGYAFDELEDFFFVRQALTKPEIDEVIQISEGYFDDNKIVYKFQQEQRLIEAPAPPPPRAPSVISAPPPRAPSMIAVPQPRAPSIYAASEIAPDEIPGGEVNVIETITTRIIENPLPEDYLVAKSERGGRSEHRAGGSVASSRSGSSEATARPPQGVNGRTVVAQVVADTPVLVAPRRKSVKSRAKSPKSGSGSESESNSALVVSRRKSVRSKDVKAEIRSLEAEERKIERKKKELEREEKESKREEKESKHESRRESRAEGRDDTVLLVEKDKRGRMVLVRPHR